MASYLRSIFRGRDSPKSSSRDASPSSSKSHLGSHPEPPPSPTKTKHFDYLYAEPGCVPVAPVQPSSRERSNSLTAARANAPSPLRYTFDPDARRGSTRRHESLSQAPNPIPEHSSKTPLYRTSSHKVGERPPPHPTFQTNDSFGSIRSSNHSVCSASYSVHRGTPSRNSSSGSVATQSTNNQEPKSVLKHHGYHGDTSKQGRHVHVSFQNPNRPIQVHMHPLLSYGRIHRAPISYDVTFPPSSRTVVDRHTHSAIPPFTLTQPATEPPTFGRFILKSERFAWEIVATTSGEKSGSASTSRAPAKRFYIEPSSTSRSRSGSAGSNEAPEPVSNLDVLYAIHTSLARRVTQAEWELLGSGSRAQRKATQAYEKRCTDMGGGWGAGVRRVDFLGGKTKLVGIEIVAEKIPSGDMITTGKLVFARP